LPESFQLLVKGGTEDRKQKRKKGAIASSAKGGTPNKVYFKQKDPSKERKREERRKRATGLVLMWVQRKGKRENPLDLEGRR